MQTAYLKTVPLAYFDSLFNCTITILCNEPNDDVFYVQYNVLLSFQISCNSEIVTDNIEIAKVNNIYSLITGRIERCIQK
jgi:hypothetical protein